MQQDSPLRHLGRPFPFALETHLPSDRFGRKHLYGSDPFMLLQAKGRHGTIHRHADHRTFEGDPLEALRSLLGELRGESGIAVGYFGYDLARHIERLPCNAQDDQDFPDLLIAFYESDDGDRRRPPALSPEQYGEWSNRSSREVPGTFSREEYLRAVSTCRNYIAAGDIYQVNLSQRFAAHHEGTPWQLYEKLCMASPAPYAAFLQFGNRALLSSSPEEFLRVEGRRIRTRPIKGTRPRGRSPDEDHRLAGELRTSRKDDAELAMIVDLERNDLGRICEYGSVRVTEPKVLETHPTVFHLSSTIEGTLRTGVDPVDILRATFPGGSITGAPKIRAMEIIDELEPTRRSAYTGAIGWIDFNGNMHLNIAIRTIQVDGPHATFQVGGAIVWDSDPAAEYEETLVKARGMAAALGLDLQKP